MVFSEEDKVLIKVLCQENGYGATQQPWSESGDWWLSCVEHTGAAGVSHMH